MFHISRKDYIGRNGWLFDKLSPPFPIETLDPQKFRQLEDIYLNLATRLREKDIRLIVVGYPEKSIVYPEMAPPEMPLMPAGGNYDRFKRLLVSRPDLITFIDAEKIIKAEKARTGENMFYKTDMHATPFAQLPVVVEIVARIADYAGRPDIRWKENITVLSGRGGWRPGHGSQARSMSTLFPPPEVVAGIRNAYSVGGAEQDGEWYIPNQRVLQAADDGVGRPFDFEFRSHPELCPQRLPGMYLISCRYVYFGF